MYTLKFKVPLIIYIESKESAYGYKNVYIHDLDLSEVHGLEKLYGQYNWITDDDKQYWKSDKFCHGFDGSEVWMDVELKDGYYILEIVSEMPLNSNVTFHKYGSSDNQDIVTMTLKEAIIFALNGQLSDGIGENEIGRITYQGKRYDVLLGELIEIDDEHFK